MIRLSHVEINQESKDTVNFLLEMGMVGQSRIIEDFEQRMANWLDVEYAVAVSSGTMADTIALAVLKYFWPGRNEVIVPALTFVAQVNSIIYNGLIPVFVDVTGDMQMNVPQAVEKVNSRTLGFFPVHLLGKPADLLSLSQASRQCKLPFVEDACEAMGSEFNPALTGWKKCGTFGDLGTFSFFPSHTVTTGEGGLIVTDNREYADLARRLRNHGKMNQADFHFDVIGFNGKMSSLQAAVGMGMVSDIDKVIEGRRRSYKAFDGFENDRIEKVCPHAFPVMAKDKEDRERILARLRAADIECRNLFSCLPTQETAYSYMGYGLGDFPVAEDIGNRGLYVPCHQGLNPDDLETIKGVLYGQEKAQKEVLT